LEKKREEEETTAEANESTDFTDYTDSRRREKQASRCGDLVPRAFLSRGKDAQRQTGRILLVSCPSLLSFSLLLTV
jgi:hypothetical protein